MHRRQHGASTAAPRRAATKQPVLAGPRAHRATRTHKAASRAASNERADERLCIHYLASPCSCPLRPSAAPCCPAVPHAPLRPAWPERWCAPWESVRPGQTWLAFTPLRCVHGPARPGTAKTNSEAVRRGARQRRHATPNKDRPDALSKGPIPRTRPAPAAPTAPLSFRIAVLQRQSRCR